MRGKTFIVAIVVWIFLINSNVWAQSTFLEEEAGISAYGTLATVDLLAAESAFKNIEYNTGEYIIGSIAIPSYAETEDVHVYLNVSGEVIAYYLKDENVGKIIDWVSYYSTNQITGTKLQTAIQIVCDAMGTSLPAINYYDFRYPAADKIKIITDEVQGGTDTFRINIPSSYNVAARFWSHCIRDESYSSTTSNFLLNDVTINTGNTGSWYFAHGDLTQTQLAPDSYHTVAVTSGGTGSGHVAIVLLYSEP